MSRWGFLRGALVSSHSKKKKSHPLILLPVPLTKALDGSLWSWSLSAALWRPTVLSAALAEFSAERVLNYTLG